MTLTHFSNVKDSNRDRLAVANAYASATSASNDSNRDLPAVANVRTRVCAERKYCRTQGSSPARYKLTRRSTRPFRCDECEFECDKPCRAAFRRTSASPLPLSELQMITMLYLQICLHLCGNCK